MTTSFSTIDDAVAAISAGEIVVVLDADSPDDGGDLICAAALATPETINFILHHAKGLLGCAILPTVTERLRLPPPTSLHQFDTYSTAYTTTTDFRSCSSGVTASDRCTTIRELANESSTAEQFEYPGHVLPLIAKEGGVLRRAGHTEASVDLARMAGLPPAGVVCEALDRSGERAKRNELMQFAKQFNLRIITIEELIRYRRQRERLVYRIADAELPTRHGQFRIIAYGVKYESQQPVALTLGDLNSVAAPLVRLHSSCFTGDLLSSLRCDCGDQLDMALKMIGREKTGVLVYLPQEGRGIGLVEKIKAYNLQDKGLDTVDANLALGFKADPRDYGVGIQILKDLELTKVRLLTNNPKKTDAFIYGGFELEVVDQVPIMPPINKHNARYMATKRDKMGHQLPKE